MTAPDKNLLNIAIELLQKAHRICPAEMGECVCGKTEAEQLQCGKTGKPCWKKYIKKLMEDRT